MKLILAIIGCVFLSGCASNHLGGATARDAVSANDSDASSVAALVERFRAAGATVEYGRNTITVKLPEQSVAQAESLSRQRLEERLKMIHLPTVSFAGASVEEAVEFVRMNFPGCDPEPGFARFNIVLKTDAAAQAKEITMDLKDVPVGEALRYIAELAGLKMTIEPFAVVIAPYNELRPTRRH